VLEVGVFGGGAGGAVEVVCWVAYFDVGLDVFVEVLQHEGGACLRGAVCEVRLK
jgi:hypothetical protein